MRTADAEAPDCSRTLSPIAVGGAGYVECSYTTTADDLGTFRNSAVIASHQHTLDVTNVVRTRVVRARPDGLIRRSRTVAFAGDDVYNTTGASQTATISAARGTTASFDIRIANDAAAPDTFLVKAAGTAVSNAPAGRPPEPRDPQLDIACRGRQQPGPRPVPLVGAGVGPLVGRGADRRGELSVDQLLHPVRGGR